MDWGKEREPRGRRSGPGMRVPLFTAGTEKQGKVCHTAHFGVILPNPSIIATTSLRLEETLACTA